MKGTEEKKDIVEKAFVSFPDITADVINVLLYRGKEIVDAQDLWAGPTETVYQGWEKLRNQYEDLCKYELADGKIKLMYLIANQSKTDSRMLFRKAGYVGGIYREQYEERRKKAFRLLNSYFTGAVTGGKAAGNFASCLKRRNFRMKLGNLLMR